MNQPKDPFDTTSWKLFNSTMVGLGYTCHGVKKTKDYVKTHPKQIVTVAAIGAVGILAKSMKNLNDMEHSFPQ